MRPVKIFAPLVFSLLATTAALADGEIKLSGTGTVFAAPDMATISTGVVTQAQTARDALDANSEAMSALVAVLREAGLEDRDIQTSNFSVQPEYIYPSQRDANGEHRPPEIVGYRVSNAVSIMVRNLDDLGVILDRAVSVGANSIDGIAFSVADPAELYNQARREAFAAAQDKAEIYADAAGFRLGSIESITELHDAAPPRPMAAMRMEAAMDSAVPVEAGELQFAVTVNVTWEIDD